MWFLGKTLVASAGVTIMAAFPKDKRWLTSEFKQGGEQPIEPDEDQGICSAQPEPRRHGSLQDNKLLAEKCHLGFASRMRSEHSDEQSRRAASRGRSSRR